MSEFNLGQIITVSWTNNNRSYKALAEITKINEKTLRAKLVEDSSGYQVNHEMVFSIVKQTKGNNISINSDLKAVQDFNLEEKRLNKLGEDFAAKYWETRGLNNV